MAATVANLVCSSSTLANFKAWAQAISTFVGGTAGWSQSTDTGQVNWSTISSVPGAGSYVFEIWQPNDSLTNFYLKIEYGNNSSDSNCPAVRLTVGTATNGAGVFSGSVVGPFSTVFSDGYTSPSATTQYECRFSGAPGRLSFLLWRLGGNSCTQAFGVERSLSASGAYTNAHVTVVTVQSIGGSSRQPVNQQTLDLTSGPAPSVSISRSADSRGGFAVRLLGNGLGTNGVFNGELGFDTIAPYDGFFDYPLTIFGVGNAANFSEGNVFTATLYGATRTYIATTSGWMGYCGPGGSASFGSAFLCVRHD